MAFTLDTSAKIAAATSDPQTVNYTCGAGTTLLVVTLAYANGTRSGAPTYNGVALTQADQVRYHSSSPEARAEIWYMLNPPTGSAYAISVPNANALSLEVCISSYLTASGYSSTLHMASGGSASRSNPSVSLTTTVTSVLVAVVADGHDTFAPSARSGTSLYETDNGTWGAGHQYNVQASAGTKAMSWTQASDDWGACVAAFMEIPIGISVSKSNVYTVTGAPEGISVSKANVYTVARPPVGISVSKAVVYSVISEAVSGGILLNPDMLGGFTQRLRGGF